MGRRLVATSDVEALTRSILAEVHHQMRFIVSPGLAVLVDLEISDLFPLQVYCKSI
jgi:hypothetical protein